MQSGCTLCMSDPTNRMYSTGSVPLLLQSCGCSASIPASPCSAAGSHHKHVEPASLLDPAPFPAAAVVRPKTVTTSSCPWVLIVSVTLCKLGHPPGPPSASQLALLPASSSAAAVAMFPMCLHQHWRCPQSLFRSSCPGACSGLRPVCKPEHLLSPPCSVIQPAQLHSGSATAAVAMCPVCPQEFPMFHTSDGRKVVENLAEFDDAREVVQGLTAEYEACEKADYVSWRSALCKCNTSLGCFSTCPQCTDLQANASEQGLMCTTCELPAGRDLQKVEGPCSRRPSPALALRLVRCRLSQANPSEPAAQATAYNMCGLPDAHSP